MPLNDDLIKRTRHTVKNYKDKVRILKKKGVSTSAFQKVGSAKELIKAFENDPKGLRKRLRELDSFSTKGEVYKSKGGLKLTQTVKTFKNREILRSRRIESARLEKARKGKLTNIEYHKTRLERLENRIENVNQSSVRSLNYATISPELVNQQRKNAVDNFMKGINFGLGGLDNSTFHNPNLEKRLRNRLSELTEDEIDDLMENNTTVKNIMNYYREKKHKWIEFSGGDMSELLEEFDQDLPSIIKHYKRLRK